MKCHLLQQWQIVILTFGSLPAGIWKDFMQQADMPNAASATPDSATTTVGQAPVQSQLSSTASALASTQSAQCNVPASEHFYSSFRGSDCNLSTLFRRSEAALRPLGFLNNAVREARLLCTPYICLGGARDKSSSWSSHTIGLSGAEDTGRRQSRHSRPWSTLSRRHLSRHRNAPAAVARSLKSPMRVTYLYPTTTGQRYSSGGIADDLISLFAG